MSYCIHPACTNPKNSDTAQQCLACGASLLLNDRYRVIKALGKGGFGATFLAQNAVLPGNPICVIKQLRIASEDPRVLERARTLFRREAATLGKIGNHPQLPALLDYFEIENQFYLVQEYVPGLTLKQEVKRYGCFKEAQVKAVLEEVLPLLQYLHQSEVIHRDIKPANIIRRQLDGRLVLIDFGAVKDEVSQTGLLLENGTMAPNTSFAIGTPGFAPREQMALKPIYASDIYALGATCLYLLIGESPRRLACDSMTGEIIWRDRVSLSDPFASILDRMLKPLVHYRYQSAHRVLADLHGAPSMDDAGSSDDTAADLTASDFSQSSDGGDGNSYGLQKASEPQEKARVEPKISHSELAEFSALTRTDRSRSVPSKGDSRTASRSLSRTPSTSLQYTRMSDGSHFTSESKLTPQVLKNAIGKGERDFADCDLSGFDLQHTNLSQVNLYGSKLIKTNLKGANLHKADLSSAGLSYAICRGADLSNAYLNYSNLSGADLRGANLTRAYLTHANLRGANLCGANLTNAKVTANQLALAKINWRTVMPNGKRAFFA